ncbi:MAG: aminotransferase class IV [Thiotrichaceae bacterium]
MQKLLETIKIIDGQPQFLEFHQQRFDRSRLTLWHCHDNINLADLLQNTPTQGIYRCRIIYHKNIEQIEYVPYALRDFKYFTVVVDDTLHYKHKFLQRDRLQQLSTLRKDADDILIIQHGMITDTSIANVAFFNGTQWLTPQQPLLAGTTRQRLLHHDEISEANITITDLAQFSKMALMNAMLGFYVIDNFIIG